MPASYTTTEDPQEPSQTALTTLPAQPGGNVSAASAPGSLGALLGTQANFSILNHYPNFFVIATSYPGHQPMSAHSSNGTSQEEKDDEEVQSVMETLTVAQNISARSETLLNTDADFAFLSNGQPWHVFSHQISVKIGFPDDEVPPRLQTTTSSFQKSIKAVLLTLVSAHVPAWLETFIVIMGIMASLAAHAINMFNYPRYELDEGTYMSSAWAIMNGMITPYPYGYGHPPLAWIQIAGWVQLTGGFFTFGNALNSGRVFMLLFALGCSLLVYLIARQISNSCSIGLLALVLFSLSPISLAYQRQVFLDNIATFWLLLSLYLIVISKSHLFYIVLAALSFGIALLSKEIFLLFMPVLIYATWLHSTRYQRKFIIITFTYVVISCGLAFILMAVLKDELFPYSWHLPWDHHPHLSMLDTFIQQAQRGQVQGKFSDAWYEWTHSDRPLVEAGIFAIAFNLLVGLWNHKHLLILLPPFRFFKRWKGHDVMPIHDKHLLLALLAISFWLLLLRGGVVLPFYFIPMIPLLALNIAAAISLILASISKLMRSKLIYALCIVVIIGVIMPYDIQHDQLAFTLHPTSAQTDAMVWVRNHVPRSAMIIINSYLYMDLREPGGQGVGNGAAYPYAHVYWNVAYDPELHDLLLQGNWDRIDYLVMDSEMMHDMKVNGGPMMVLYTALQHSILRAEFRADDKDKQIVISIYQVIHKQASPNLS
jgi:4-amino-4-deoxy-L-arabinose transferase-like glycosyltransferase